MKTKETVHNELEAKTLIEEAYSRGTEEMYQGTKFYTHAGQFLFTCEINLVTYSRHMPNGDTVTKEL